MKFFKIFFTLIFCSSFSNYYVFSGIEEDKKLTMALLLVFNEKLSDCVDLSRVFELSQILRREQPRYLDLVNMKGFAESLFKIRGYDENKKNNIKKIEVCAALGMSKKLNELLDSCEKVSMIINAIYIVDNKRLVDYAEKFKLEAVVKILQEYENDLD